MRGETRPSHSSLNLRPSSFPPQFRRPESNRFFKTGQGEYGEGDTFIGVNVPTLRTVAREFRGLPLDEIGSLLDSPVHEMRQLALLVLVLQATKGDDAHRERAFDLYLGNTRFVNNWDLVDCSAPQVVGGYLLTRPKKPLYTRRGRRTCGSGGSPSS